MYVDVHAHLSDSAFDRDRDEVMARSREIIILDAGLNHESNVKVLNLSRKHSNLRACLGFHPEYIVTSPEQQVDLELNFIRENAASLVAISEIGLDYKYPEHEKQINAFKRFLKLAEELNLPVVLHSRRAAGAVLNLLRSFSLRVNLHAFSGNMIEAKNALDQGYYFSVGPNIVYNKYRQELTKLIPVEQMLTETDSPVLGPDPNQRNEPHNIFLALDKIAEIKGVELSELKDRIYRNSANLFKL
jgi:TatD DNase family protein